MTSRRDPRFTDTALPTLPSIGISASEWETLIAPYYPTSFSSSIQQSVKMRLLEFGVNPDHSVPKVGGTIKLNLNTLDGLSEALLTLFTLGYPLHTAQLFYPYFNSETRDTIEKLLDFSNYRYKLEYCLMDRIHKVGKEQTGTVYRGTNAPFPFKVGSIFQFHHFASASKDVGISDHFLKPNGTMFEIRASRALSMAKYSQYPHENEYLIHPFEEFNVHEVHKYCSKTWVVLLRKGGWITDV